MNRWEYVCRRLAFEGIAGSQKAKQPSTEGRSESETSMSSFCFELTSTKEKRYKKICLSRTVIQLEDFSNVKSEFSRVALYAT